MKVDKGTIITKIKHKSLSDSKKDCFICEWANCYDIFESVQLLSSHVTQFHATATFEGSYYCKWLGCTRSDRGFNARYKMLVHVRTHTKEKPHTCNICEKSFSRSENLKIHLRSHSGEKPYICPHKGCNKAYSNSSDRFKHTKTHSTQKPYNCKISGCQKRYTDPSSLRKHVKTFKHNQIMSQQNLVGEHAKFIQNRNKIEKLSNLNVISNSQSFYSPRTKMFTKSSVSHNCRSQYSVYNYQIFKESVSSFRYRNNTRRCDLKNNKYFKLEDNFHYKQPENLMENKSVSNDLSTKHTFHCDSECDGKYKYKSTNFKYSTFRGPMNFDLPLDLRVSKQLNDQL